MYTPSYDESTVINEAKSLPITELTNRSNRDPNFRDIISRNIETVLADHKENSISQEDGVSLQEAVFPGSVSQGLWNAEIDEITQPDPDAAYEARKRVPDFFYS